MKTCAADTACGFFGSGGLIVYEMNEERQGFETHELLPVLLLGVIGGLVGSAFNHANQVCGRPPARNSVCLVKAPTRAWDRGCLCLL
jgi:H+/Cl- antiporter ClcA